MALVSITTSLLPLIYLACPVGMGAMMLIMMRGSRSRSKPRPDTADPSLADLKAQQARLAAEIDRLEHHADAPTPTTDEASR